MPPVEVRPRGLIGHGLRRERHRPADGRVRLGFFGELRELTDDQAEPTLAGSRLGPSSRCAWISAITAGPFSADSSFQVGC
ncbi:MAG: hypothetical protein GVY09_12810 [Gammaproteobacteria bacterium]|jgi:hypothetical protein|nr:hypothetical protein [Gammaproteobacteria bacterium]